MSSNGDKLCFRLVTELYFVTLRHMEFLCLYIMKFMNFSFVVLFMFNFFNDFFKAVSESSVWGFILVCGERYFCFSKRKQQRIMLKSAGLDPMAGSHFRAAMIPELAP